jgi:hypothetical protein
MSTKSRESIYGSSIRASAERAKEARKDADRLACVAWNQRMLGYKGPAQPSPALGDALNACACRKSNPDILVMQSTQDRTAKNVSSSLNGARYWCILVQR